MELTPETQARIFAAADALYEQAGRTAAPTVDAVRKAAKVAMNDANAGMKEWRRLKLAPAVAIVTVPEAVMEAGRAAFSALWSQAQELANETLRAAQAGWEVERAEADTLNQQLSDAHDEQAAMLADAERARDEAQEACHGLVSDCDRLRAELSDALHEVAAAKGALAVAQQSEVEKERRAVELRIELDRARQDLSEVRAELRAVGVVVGEQREALADSKTELGTLRAKYEAQAASLVQERGKAEAAFTDMARALEERDAARLGAGKAREELALLRGELEAFKAQNVNLMAALTDGAAGRKAAGSTPKKNAKD